MKNLDLDGLDCFAAATAVAAKPAKGKKTKTEVTIKGLELIAALDAASKTIKSLIKTERENVDVRVREYFVENGARLTSQPENFRGVEGKASASCELRKRGTTSPLTDVEIQILEENGIPFGEVKDVTETFIINPEYLGDASLMARVAKALAGTAGMPKDFIKKQVAKTTHVVTDETVATVFSKPDKLGKLLKTVTVIALKPQTGVEISDTFKMIADLVSEKNGDEEKE